MGRLSFYEMGVSFALYCPLPSSFIIHPKPNPVPVHSDKDLFRQPLTFFQRDIEAVTDIYFMSSESPDLLFPALKEENAMWADLPGGVRGT